MKLSSVVKIELIRVIVGSLILDAVMVIIFILAGKWDLSVLWGTLLGTACALLNFFIMAVDIQKATANHEKAVWKMQVSYLTRLGLIAVVLYFGLTRAIFNWLAVVIPLLFPRIILSISNMRYKRKEGEE